MWFNLGSSPSATLILAGSLVLGTSFARAQSPTTKIIENSGSPAQIPETADQAQGPKVITAPPPLAPGAAPSEPTPVTVASPPAQPVTLDLGQSKTITSPKPIGTIQIPNENIVDAVVLTDRSAVLIAKSPGRTYINIFDDKNSLMTTLDVFIPGSSGTPNRVLIHNGKRVSDAQEFSCVPGCEFVGDVVSKQVGPEGPPPPQRSTTTEKTQNYDKYGNPNGASETTIKRTGP